MNSIERVKRYFS